jgi:hypothetical protein
MMADLRCPMCGKDNPDHLEKCQFCEARLKPLLSSSPPDDSPASSESDLPDWLRSMGDNSLEDTDDQTPFSDDSESQVWLDRLGADPDHGKELPTQSSQQPPSEPPSRGVVPDWMSDMVSDEPLPPIDADDNGIPDWLEEFQVQRASGQEEKDEEPSSNESLPDWFTGEDEPEIAPAEPAAEGDLPDWLSDLGEVHIESEQPLATTPDMGAKEDSTPDWLSDKEEVEITPAEPAAEGDLPDWLTGLEDTGVEQPVGSANGEDEEGLQDWFTSLEEDQELEAPPAPETGSRPHGEEDSRALPPWLREMEPVSSAEAGDSSPISSVAPFVADDEFGDEDLLDEAQIPDWISAEDEWSAAAPQEESAASDLTPAELPGWVAAMKPVKAPEERGPVETSGPLAGLHSVLSAEPEIARLKKPPAYSIKLDVTETQQSHAAIFEGLLSAEGQPAPIPKPPLISSQRILRAVIGIVLISLVGLFVIAGSQVFPSPEPGAIPTEVISASQLVNNLPAMAPVLVTFDYEPGMSGEMEAVAASIIDRLMSNGAYLTLVSTSPTGPALAEHFIRDVQAEHQYQGGLQYINLGYIPGGVSGLSGFAEMPEKVTKFSFDGMQAWETRPLQGISSLSDFALWVLITDNPNTARAWIEQVRPKIGDTPLIAVISAQAEPLIRPYYSSANPQVNGMISGLAGGIAYEQTVGKDNLARDYWDAFNVGLAIAFGAILIGGGINLVSVFSTSRKEKNEGVA